MHANDMNDQRYDYDVIVIGAGPSGLTTATALARSGVRVLVVEKHRGLSIFPKATGIRPRSMEILRGWGLEAEVRRRSQPNQLGMAISPTLAVPGQVVELGLPTDEVVAAVTPTRLAICGQDQLEQVLHDHLRVRGGTIRFRTEMVGFSQTDDAVCVTLRPRDGQASYQVTAQYLVGADGGRSQVRAGVGIEFEPLGSEGNHLAVLFDADLSAVLPDPPYVLNAVVAPGVEGLFATTGQPTRWIYDMEWHPEAGEQLEDWTAERIIARLRAASGLPDLNPKIIGVFPWDFGAGIAHGYRRGRVFLVGDAAHRTTPRGATGMNTGIADGHNLGWKLTLGDQGLGDGRAVGLLRGRARTGGPGQRRGLPADHDRQAVRRLASARLRRRVRLRGDRRWYAPGGSPRPPRLDRASRSSCPELIEWPGRRFDRLGARPARVHHRPL